MNKRDGAIAAQAVIRARLGRGLRVDGVWGPQSQAAFQRLDEASRSTVTDMLGEMGVSLSNGSRPPPAWISRSALEPIVRDVAKETSINPSYFWFLLDYEPLKRFIGGEIHYDVTSVSSSYRGLAQMGLLAWTDASNELMARTGRDDLGSWESKWSDPRQSLRAAGWYAVANTKRLRQAGYSGVVTNDLLYAMHNQGPSFVESVRTGGKGRWFSQQSTKAKRTLELAAEQLRAVA